MLSKVIVVIIFCHNAQVGFRVKSKMTDMSNRLISGTLFAQKNIKRYVVKAPATGIPPPSEGFVPDSLQSLLPPTVRLYDSDCIRA